MWHELNGTVGYAAGAAGTVTVPEGACVTQIIAHSTAGGTVSIFGGNNIPLISAAASWIWRPHHTLWQANSANGQSIVFTGTDSYYVEWVFQR
jgi:hypothetical protein